MLSLSVHCLSCNSLAYFKWVAPTNGLELRLLPSLRSFRCYPKPRLHATDCGTVCSLTQCLSLQTQTFIPPKTSRVVKKHDMRRTMRHNLYFAAWLKKTNTLLCHCSTRSSSQTLQTIIYSRNSPQLCVRSGNKLSTLTDAGVKTLKFMCRTKSLFPNRTENALRSHYQE